MNLAQHMARFVRSQVLDEVGREGAIDRIVAKRESPPHVEIVHASKKTLPVLFGSVGGNHPKSAQHACGQRNPRNEDVRRDIGVVPPVNRLVKTTEVEPDWNRRGTLRDLP